MAGANYSVQPRHMLAISFMTDAWSLSSVRVAGARLQIDNSNHLTCRGIPAGLRGARAAGLNNLPPHADGYPVAAPS
jgi:hypothetical protein